MSRFVNGALKEKLKSGFRTYMAFATPMSSMCAQATVASLLLISWNKMVTASQVEIIEHGHYNKPAVDIGVDSQGVYITIVKRERSESN